MQGKTVVITGATSGIGEAAAESLARMGARVVFVARDAGKGEAMLDRLRTIGPAADHDWVQADLATLAGMRAAGAALAGKAPRIDVLANNAGAVFDSRHETADGLELTFALNHMAYFVITSALRPNLAPDARIVSTSSAAHVASALDFDDLQSTKRYSTFIAYGRSKLCNILFTRALARRLQGTGITANCLHPGGVSTGFGSNLGPGLRFVLGAMKPLFLSAAQGADTLVYLASSDAVAGKSGGYYARRRLTRPSAAARDDEAAERLWRISEQIAA